LCYSVSRVLPLSSMRRSSLVGIADSGLSAVAWRGGVSWGSVVPEAVFGGLMRLWSAAANSAASIMGCLICESPAVWGLVSLVVVLVVFIEHTKWLLVLITPYKFNCSILRILTYN
jgi:hypothetical protein